MSADGVNGDPISMPPKPPPGDSWRPSFRYLISFAGIFGFAFCLLVAGRLSLPFLEPEESLYAAIPLAMLTSDHFVVPYLHGEPYLDKPPLLYWSVMVCYRVIGVQVPSARLVPALVSWLTVLVVFAWGCRCGGRMVGLLAAAVLTLTGDFVYRVPMLTPNGLLGLFTTMGLALGHVAIRRTRIQLGWWVASAVATGFGVLTKGPIAVVLVAVPLLVLPRAIHGFSRPGFAHAAVFGAIVTLVAGPWFLAVAARHPEFVEYFFWTHHVRRFADPFDHAKPFGFYLPQAFLGGLPWTILVPLGLANDFLPNFRSNFRVTSDARFAWLAAAFGLLFFSLSGSKRSVYLVPLWPVFAFGCGHVLASSRAGSVGSFGPVSRRVGIAGAVLTSVALTAGVFVWLPDYHRRFGLEEACRIVLSRDPAIAVYGFPHSWNSLEFSLAGQSLPVIAERDRPLIAERIRSGATMFVVAKNGDLCTEFRASWGNDLNVTDVYAGPLVTILELKSPESREPNLPKPP